MKNYRYFKISIVNEREQNRDPSLGWFEESKKLGKGCPGIHNNLQFKTTMSMWCIRSRGGCPLKGTIDAYTCQAVIGYERI